MNKFISKFFIALSVALMTAGFAACSKDNGDDPDNNGSGKGDKMTGWVEIDGKKYDLKWCFDDAEELEYGESNNSSYIIASSVNLDDKNAYKKKADLAEFYVVKNSDGTLSYSLELFPNIKLSGDDEDETGYETDSYQNLNKNVVYTKDGDNVEFSCNDATFTHYNKFGDVTGNVHGKFHFKGVPRKFKNMIIE